MPHEWRGAARHNSGRCVTYTARVCDCPLQSQGAPDMAINLWEVPFGGGGTGRGRIVGSLSPPARVEISRRARRAGEDRYYYLVSRGDQRGWVPETMVERSNR